MSETRGVFSLSRVFAKKRNNQWVSLEDVWIDGTPTSSPNTGYFGGGQIPPNVATVDKLDYSTDTTEPIPGANLSAARRDTGATGNSEVGYFGGGIGGPPFSTMDKLTYSTDTTEPIPGASLSVPRYGPGATGNETVGYFGGGGHPGLSPAVLSTMDKLTYPVDTTAEVPGAPLSSERYGMGVTGNSTHAYFAGGAPGPLSTVDKLSYSSETIEAVPGVSLSLGGRYAMGAAGNSTAGYFGGGRFAGNASTMEKLDYSTDTTEEVPGAALSSPRDYVAATGNSTSGYFGGGRNPNNVSTVDKFEYSIDTTEEVPGAALSSERNGVGALSSKSNVLLGAIIPESTRFSDGLPEFVRGGYFGGGTSYNMRQMDKISYYSDTVTTLPNASLSSARRYLTATGNSEAGYFGGGGTYLPIESTMDKLTYSFDTAAAAPSLFLSVARYHLGATGNETAGYFIGGYAPAFSSRVSTVDKLTYSSNLSALAPGAALSIDKLGHSATGNQTHGYFGGGNIPSAPYNMSTMDKLTYSSDTTSPVPGANLSSDRNYVASTGNSTHGYFGSGSPRTTLVDKIIYSTDTRVAVPGITLNVAAYQMGATGNSTAGYFAGGDTGSIVSSVQKLDYSTETSAVVSSLNQFSNKAMGATSPLENALPAAAVPTDAPRVSATPTSQTAVSYLLGPVSQVGYFGYFAGGFESASRSEIFKLSYSTETTEITTRSPLSIARGFMASTGNSTAGYYAGGWSPLYSTTDKITYASDTGAAVPTAAIPSGTYHFAATGNLTAGYFAGGIQTGSKTRMDKLTYSSETTLEAPGSALPAPRWTHTATGNSTHGYFAGGYGGGAGYISAMDKITYSTDTVGPAPASANLSTECRLLAATGNSTHGYFGGGNPGNLSTMDMLEYATDTKSPVPGANLSVGRDALAATGNSTYGYFGGGRTPSYVSTMDRLTYSTTTTAEVPGAALIGVRRYLNASSALSNGFSGSVQVPFSGTISV